MGDDGSSSTLARDPYYSRHGHRQHQRTPRKLRSLCKRDTPLRRSYFALSESSRSDVARRSIRLFVCWQTSRHRSFTHKRPDSVPRCPAGNSTATSLRPNMARGAGGGRGQVMPLYERLCAHGNYLDMCVQDVVTLSSPRTGTYKHTVRCRPADGYRKTRRGIVGTNASRPSDVRRNISFSFRLQFFSFQN